MNDRKNKKAQKIKSKILQRLGDILQDSDGLVTLVKLNLLFIVTCLPFIPFVPLFTSGPAIKSLLYCTNELVRTGYIGDVKNKYMSAFKSGFAKSSRYGAAFVLLTVFFMGGLYFYLIMSGGSILYIPFASLSLLALISIWGISAHLFPSITESITCKELVALSVNSALSNMKKTITAAVVSVAFIIALILFLPASLPVMIAFGFSAPALCCAFAHTEPEFV